MSTPALVGAGGPTLRIRGTAYPVLLPTLRDPRLHLATVIVSLQVLGQVAFDFRLSIAQILVSLGTCAVLEFGIAFWRRRVIMWPASAMLTGNGVAFVLRVPGTEHGDWWSMRGAWIFAATSAVGLLSKYVIRFRGRHVFNPSNFGLVICFLTLGAARAEPLDFWWGPMSFWLALALAIIVVGGFAILARLKLLGIAVGFWLAFAAGIGVLAVSGHSMTARWHLGPITGVYFWWLLVTSPELLVFLFYMITDPKTTPKGRMGQRVYAVGVGLLATLLIAPQHTEYATKVALLGSLAIACAAQPLIELLAGVMAVARIRAVTTRRTAVGAMALTGAAGFAGLVVLAGIPARSSAGALSAPVLDIAHLPRVTILRSEGVAMQIDGPTGQRIARDVVADLHVRADALRRRSAAYAAVGVGDRSLAELKRRIRAAAGRAVVVPEYRIEQLRVTVEPGKGQGPPVVVATLSGAVQNTTYAGSPAMVQRRAAAIPVQRTLDLTLDRGRFLIVGDHEAKTATPALVAAGIDRSRGTSDFARVHLTDVASQVGLNFRQSAFRYSTNRQFIAADPIAMTGGGLCWLDYNNDGWMDLFVVNSYADADLPQWDEHGGMPRSALFENVRGRFVNVSARSHADPAVKGSGCVAADFNEDGHTDLYVTSGVDDVLLWNNGNGTFTEAATRSIGISGFGWHGGAAVADVNSDGRPDLVVIGYTDANAVKPNSFAGYPNNHLGVRDLLYLNQGNDTSGRARFREVGQRVGLDSRIEHGLGAVFTDVNGDGRPDLYVANDGDPNRLYLNVALPGGVKADPLKLGFRLQERGHAEGVDDPKAGMGVAAGDYNGDGHADLLVTNSRGQPHAVFASHPSSRGVTLFASMQSEFATALHRRGTVGWGASWVDLDNDGNPDLILANGAIPLSNLKKDTGPIQVLENLAGRGQPVRVENASGIIDPRNLPPIIGRGLAAADYNNDGRVDVAINSINGPLVLLQNTGASGHWLEVALSGFHPGALVTAVLPDGRRLVREVQAGSSYQSSEDPRVHFGLGTATKVRELIVRYPDGHETHRSDVSADRILTVLP